MDPNAPKPDPNETRGPEVLAAVITFPALGLLMVMLRLYTRFRIIHNPSWDDLCIVIGVIMSITVTICTIFEVQNGMGRHAMYVSPEEVTGYLKALFASILTYNLGLTFTKLSILLQYIHICASQKLRRVCFVMVGFIILYCLTTFFTGVFTCYPVALYWDSTVPNGHCVDKWALYYANAGMNIGSDFVILILPFLILRGLLLPRKQKIALMVVLAFGGLACIASIFRLYVLWGLSLSKDPTWDNPGTATWSAIELNVGIICACVTTLRPLLSRIAPRAFGSQASRPRGQNYYGRSRSRRAPSGGRFDTIGENMEQDQIGLKGIESGSLEVRSKASHPHGDDVSA